MENKAIDLMEIEAVKTLKNGVVVYDLSDFVEEDFQEADEILQESEHLEYEDSENTYNERIENNFVGIYSVTIERQADYQRFIEKIEREKDHYAKLYNDLKDEISDKFSNYILKHSEANMIIEYLDDMLFFKQSTCKCSICSFHAPSFEEWKSGKYKDGKRVIKLGKAMRKAGYSQELLDFYSLQIKTEKSVFLTVSDLPQHIAGMSYYAKLNSWDGANGTSCQDPRHNYEEVIRLLGSLHDNKLFVGLLHESLEDISEMNDKLIARTVFRLVHIDDEQVLLATNYYGNNTTKDYLHNCIKQLEQFNILPKNIQFGKNRIFEPANGYVERTFTDEIHIHETIEEYPMVECPVCEGTGEYEAYNSYTDRNVSIDCPNPSCNNGEMESYVCIELDEYVEVEDTQEIAPYAEGYEHMGHHIKMDVNLDKIKEVIQRNKGLNIV